MKREVGSRYCHQLPTINDNVYFPLWLRHWQNRYYLKVSADYKMQNNANNSSHDSSKIHYTLCRSFSSRKTNATSITFQEIFAIYNSYCIAPAVTDYWYNQCTENCQHLIVIISEPVEFAQDFFFLLGSIRIVILINAVLPFSAPALLTCMYISGSSGASEYIVSIWVMLKNDLQGKCIYQSDLLTQDLDDVCWEL